MQNSKKFFIATFYKCFSFEQTQLLENLLKRQFKKLKIVGTVIFTPEGINSTIASQNLVSLKKAVQFQEPARLWKECCSSALPLNNHNYTMLMPLCTAIFVRLNIFSLCETGPALPVFFLLCAVPPVFRFRSKHM